MPTGKRSFTGGYRPHISAIRPHEVFVRLSPQELEDLQTIAESASRETGADTVRYAVRLVAKQIRARNNKQG